MITSYKITILNTGQCYQCEKEATLLKGIERLAIRTIPVGCRGGGCGVCKIRIVSGAYNCKRMSRAHISPEEQALGVVLACRVLPESDIELEVLDQTQ